MTLLQNPSAHQIIMNILNNYMNLQFPHEWDNCKDQIYTFLQAIGWPAVSKY